MVWREERVGKDVDWIKIVWIIKIKWIRTQNITCVRKLNSSCPKDCPILFKIQIFGF